MLILLSGLSCGLVLKRVCCFFLTPRRLRSHGPVPVYRAPKNQPRTLAVNTRVNLRIRGPLSRRKTVDILEGLSKLTYEHVSTVGPSMRRKYWDLLVKSNFLKFLRRRLDTEQGTARYQGTQNNVPKPNASSATGSEVHLHVEKSEILQKPTMTDA